MLWRPSAQPRIMGAWVKRGIMGQVDVAICVYSKPYSTAVTLASLIEHSRQHIGGCLFNRKKNRPTMGP